MIKIVPDTNIILGGMFGYQSPQRKLLSLSLLKKIQLVGSSETYKEFCEKSRMERLQRYWEPKNFSPDKIILDYQSLMLMHEPSEEVMSIDIPIQDPDDAIFIRVALSIGAKIIISEDKHLLVMDGFNGLKILKADKFIEVYKKIHEGSLISWK